MLSTIMYLKHFLVALLKCLLCYITVALKKAVGDGRLKGGV